MSDPEGLGPFMEGRVPPPATAGVSGQAPSLPGVVDKAYDTDRGLHSNTCRPPLASPQPGSLSDSAPRHLQLFPLCWIQHPIGRSRIWRDDIISFAAT